MRRAIGWGVLALALTGGPLAGQEKKNDALEKALLAPELVFKYARDIGLKPGQRQTIVDAIKNAQGELVGLQLSMAEPAQDLLDLLDRPTVDEAAALAQADRVLTIERDLKKRQMSLLIRIKNALTPEQQAKLRELRDAAARSDGAGSE